MQYTGSASVINLFVQIGFIGIAFMAINSLKIDKMFRKPTQALPMLIVLTSIVLGTGCANFFIGFFTVLHGAFKMMG